MAPESGAGVGSGRELEPEPALEPNPRLWQGPNAEPERGPNPCPGLKSRGFTLIELLIVVAIMAIMLAVAIPAVNGLNDKWRLEGAAWRLATDMRLARQRAITTGKYTRFEFRQVARDYRMWLPVEKKTVKLPEGIDYCLNNFPLTGGIHEFSISPLGAPTQGGTVGLKNRRGGKLYVIITPATGRVRVSPEAPAGNR